MCRRAALVAFFFASFVSLRGQSAVIAGCLPRPEFAPVIVENTGLKVTFKCDHATPLELIRTVGFQTRLPIGVILGVDPNALSREKHSYDLDHVDARSALLEAIEGTGYTIRDEDNVMILIADDLTSHQRDLLAHEYDDFKPGSGKSMVLLGTMLTMWMRAAVDPKAGTAVSILGSMNDERFSLRVAPVATTEQIANQIVNQGSKGMWIFRVSALSSSAKLADEVNIEPYQHYSNAPVTNQ